MKRVAYVLRDAKYGGAGAKLKSDYYSTDKAIYGALAIDGPVPAFAERVAEFQKRLLKKTDDLRTSGVRDTHLLDHCSYELAEAAEMLRTASASDLATTGEDLLRNQRTLTDLQRLCNFPAAGQSG
jgi:hypothetical protein